MGFYWEACSTAQKVHTMLVRIFKALGNETRLAIFEHIRSQEYDCRSDVKEDCCVPNEDRTVCVSHISRKFPRMGQTAISQHLKVLHEAGLLVRHKVGSWVYYTIAPDPLRELQTYFAQERQAPNGPQSVGSTQNEANCSVVGSAQQNHGSVR
jgi:ArsR family transcriptional regulator